MGDAVSLTKAQIVLLEALSHRLIVFPRGATIRVAAALENKGFVSVASIRAGVGYTMTDAGRSALESIGGDHG